MRVKAARATGKRIDAGVAKAAFRGAPMFQVRIHGRGGQGVVSAAEMLSVAAFDEGRFSQAFPSFGSERMGAPVMAFCRIDDRPIRLREPVVRPDAIIVQDPTLLHQVHLFAGLAPDGYILVNSGRGFEALGLGDFVRALAPERCRTVAASELAMKSVGRPLPNAALLGGFAAMTGEVSIDAVCAAIRAKFPGRTGEANAIAARGAFELVRAAEETHA
jgi:pyruvate ferredoxin oxidoreductase gamma subunit